MRLIAALASKSQLETELKSSQVRSWKQSPSVLKSCPIFTRKRLRYIWVFAVAIPSVVCLSSVCLSSIVCLPVCRWCTLLRGVEPFGKISLPLCTLAILWPQCKILQRSSKGNPSAGSVKRKRGIKIAILDLSKAISHKRYKIDI